MTTSYKPYDPDRAAEIVAAFVDRGETHAAIGLRHGISGGRVGAILAAAGVDSMAVRLARSAKAKAERKAAKQAERKAQRAQRKRERDEKCIADAEPRYASWRQMWAEGLTLRQMSERLGKPLASVADSVIYWRKRAGWFPYRCADKRPPRRRRSKVNEKPSA